MRILWPYVNEERTSPPGFASYRLVQTRQEGRRTPHGQASCRTARHPFPHVGSAGSELDSAMSGMDASSRGSTSGLSSTMRGSL